MNSDFLDRGYIIYSLTGKNYGEAIELFIGSRQGAEERARILSELINYDETYEVSAVSYPVYEERYG